MHVFIYLTVAAPHFRDTQGVLVCTCLNEVKQQLCVNLHNVFQEIQKSINKTKETKIDGLITDLKSNAIVSLLSCIKPFSSLCLCHAVRLAVEPVGSTFVCRDPPSLRNDVSRLEHF